MVGGAATVVPVEAAAVPVAKLLRLPAGGQAAAGAQAGRGRRHRGALVLLGVRHAAARLPQLRAHHPTAQPGGAPQRRTPPALVEAAAVAKLLVAEQLARRQAAAGAIGEHWSFAYAMLRRLSRSFALIIRQLNPAELRNAVCVFYLVLRALDTVEDDTSIPTEVKVTILQEFHRHIYNRDWHFSCGKKDHKVLMDKFHYISTAFLELDPGYQKAIEVTTRRMGAGMAKFVCKEVETIEDYDEYCHYAAGLVGSGLFRLFNFIGLENLAPHSIYNSTSLFLQKINIIRDYLEDINEVPKPRMFWPREIWIKYINKLEDFKYEENSEKAVQCLNEMITNGLIHAEDCLRCLSSLKDVSILHSCAIPQVMAIAMYAHCYNNVNIFRGAIKIRRGLAARIIVETNSMADVFTAFYNFSLLIESKIDSDDPNAMLTRQCVNAIKETCKSSGLLKGGWEFDLDKATKCNYGMVMMLLLLWVAVLYGVIYVK